MFPITLSEGGKGKRFGKSTTDLALEGEEEVVDSSFYRL